METEENIPIEKVSNLNTSENTVKYDLPYGWRKIAQRRKNPNTSKNWDIYLISPDNKRLRSNVELKKYLDENPNVKCDLSVTNTQTPKQTNSKKEKKSSAKLIKFTKNLVEQESAFYPRIINRFTIK